MDIGQIVSVVAAALIAGVAAWLVRGRDVSKLKQDLETAEIERVSLRGTASGAREELAHARARLEDAQKSIDALEEARQRITDLSVENERLRTELKTAAQQHGEQVEQLVRLRQEVQDQFKLLAGDVLKVSSEDFLKRADEIFQQQKERTNADIDKRAKDISDLVTPLGKSLEAYELMVKEIEKSRLESFGGISEALKAVSAQHGEVRAVTANLVDVLKASPKTRGRWGEETLRRVVELSGMVEHCDFETEQSRYFRADDESLRPDMLIHVSGGRLIVVDAKAPVSAYLEAIGATTNEEREALLAKHASQLRERLNNLSNKSYWARFEGSVDCVVMFVPGDNFVSAAFERDPDLFEDGIKNRVLICTPTTFIALAKAISYGWRQERLAQNAVEVGKHGKALYERLGKLGGHILDLGKYLEGSVKRYNLMVGSLENSVMPQARRFNELGVDGTAQPLPELVEVDTVPRLPQPGRDLSFAEPEDRSPKT